MPTMDIDTLLELERKQGKIPADVPTKPHSMRQGEGLRNNARRSTQHNDNDATLSLGERELSE